MSDTNQKSEQSNPLNEIIQPFIDLFDAPRALHGVNWAYFVEGIVYWGFLSYFVKYFNTYVKLSDIHSGWMVGILTMGITISMFFLGGLADKWGVRKAMIIAFFLMIIGRSVLSASPYLNLPSGSLFSLFNILAFAGILFIVSGYGMYQPAAYAAVRQFTTEKSAGPAYAMLYALMNLGGWLPTWFTSLRKSVGISGVYALLTALTIVALLLTIFLLDKKTVRDRIAFIKEALTQSKEGQDQEEKEEAKEQKAQSIGEWFSNHPLADPKFAYFIFCLIPVQTLFAHNWLTMPLYVERGYRETWPWISINFEKAVNFNPLLIFILVPIVTSLTQKKNVYNMMIWGTLIMAAPTFLLAIGPYWWTLLAYLIIMTVGEAMWQPRFLQYAAEIAPEGRTGAYMGVAQFPWFLTKLIVPIYSGWFLGKYCPETGEQNTQIMWLIYAIIALSSTAMLILAKGWLGKDFKTKAE